MSDKADLACSPCFVGSGLAPQDDFASVRSRTSFSLSSIMLTVPYFLHWSGTPFSDEIVAPGLSLAGMPLAGVGMICVGSCEESLQQEY